jgi:hypothetical protein
MAAEGEFPKADGDVLFASEINLVATRVLQFYTGGDLDVSGTAGSANYEFDDFTFGTTTPDYIELNVLGTFVCGANASGGANVRIKIEAKELGGA